MVLMSRPSSTPLHRVTAGLAAAALLALGACTTTSADTPNAQPTPTAVASSTQTSSAPATTAPTSSAPATSAAPTTAAPTTHTDESLAAIVDALTYQGAAVQAFPVALIRNATKAPSMVTPEACRFIEDGPEPQVKAGAPAGFGATDAGAGATLIALASADQASVMLARLATTTGDPQCASYTVDGGPVVIKAEKVDVPGLQGGLKLTTTEKNKTKVSLSGHQGNLLVIVNAPQGQDQDLPALVAQILTKI